MSLNEMDYKSELRKLNEALNIITSSFFFLVEIVSHSLSLTHTHTHTHTHTQSKCIHIHTHIHTRTKQRVEIFFSMTRNNNKKSVYFLPHNITRQQCFFAQKVHLSQTNGKHTFDSVTHGNYTWPNLLKPGEDYHRDFFFSFLFIDRLQAFVFVS